MSEDTPGSRDTPVDSVRTRREPRCLHRGAESGSLVPAFLLQYQRPHLNLERPLTPISSSSLLGVARGWAGSYIYRQLCCAQYPPATSS